MAVFIDLNTVTGIHSNSILLADEYAINNSLYNLFSCPIGSRGFNPEYGTRLWHLLFDPCDTITANKIENALLQSIDRWEPRIKLLQRQDIVYPLDTNDGYKIFIPYNIPRLNKSSTFSMKAMQR